MGGMFGIGGSAAKTDRGSQLTSRQNLFDIFSYGLPTGETGQASGQADLSKAMSTLGIPEQYWKNLMTAGRTQTAQNAAPAVSQVLANTTANRNIEGTFGTSRTGGTAAANREAGSQAQSQIDQIINENLLAGREAGAKGLEGTAALESSIGGTELSNALSLLGLSQNSIEAILQDASGSRQFSTQQSNQLAQSAGQAAAAIALAFL